MKDENVLLTRTEGLISIIVPVYNAKDYITKCVNSILQQSYQQIELILIDDGSTDGSANICDMVKDIDCRVQVIHSVNGGAAAARNKGLDIARGEYIMFVDSDDYIDLQLCEKLLQGLKSADAKCCMSGYQIVTEQDKGQCFNAESVVCMSGKSAIEKRYIDGCECINIINPWGKLYHWSMWKKIRFTSGLYYEDLDVMPYLYLYCDKVVCIPDIGYFYLQRIGSCSHGVDTDDKRYIDSLIIRKKHISFFLNEGEKELALSIMRKTIELIITSDCNGWIPKSYKKESKGLFLTYWKDVLGYSQVPVKDKIRYAIYRYWGSSIYRICISMISGK